MALTYTTIQHGFRKAHGLSLIQYTLCDMIYFLSNRQKSASPGWCYMSKSVMSEELGVTKRTVLNLINDLIGSGFLEKNEETKFLRTTQKWESVYVLDSGEKISPMVKNLRSVGEKISPVGGEKISPNNIYTNNNTDKEAEASLFVSLIEKSREIFSEAGLDGVFFQKVKMLHSLSDVEVNNFHDAWKKKNQALGTDFKSKDHLKRSFNRFIAEAKGSGGKTGIPINPTQPSKIKFTGKLI